MMNRKNWLLYLATVSALVLTACGNDNTGNDNGVDDNDNPDTEEVTGTENEGETSDFVEIEDSAGNLVEVPFRPERIAVMDNGVLDNIQALGYESNVVFTVDSTKPDHLSYFNDVEASGSFFEIDLEATFAAEPDLIIVAGRSSSAYDDLADIAPILDLSFEWTDYWTTTQQNIERLATIFGEEEQAATVIEDIQGQIDHLAEQAEDSGYETLFTMYNEGSLSAFGPASRYGIVHEEFGFGQVDEGIEASQHGMDISYEYILDQDPDVIFVLDRTQAVGGDDSNDPIEENPLVQETQAYQNDLIINLTPGPWYLAEGGAGTIQLMIEEVSSVFE